jgi:hypothetical protein
VLIGFDSVNYVLSISISQNWVEVCAKDFKVCIQGKIKLSWSNMFLKS